MKDVAVDLAGLQGWGGVPHRNLYTTVAAATLALII